MAQRRKPRKATQVALRVDPATLDRAAALADRMAQRADLRAFRLSRAAVLRLALLRGLDALEAENPDDSGTGRRGR
jgi:hypothetical protein